MTDAPQHLFDLEKLRAALARVALKQEFNPTYLGNGLWLRQLVRLLYQGPRSPQQVEAILYTPRARRVLTRNWEEDHLSMDYVAAMYAPEEASPAERELAAAAYELAWELHLSRCEPCKAHILTP